MSNIWLTSDFHFGHDREFVWKARGYSSVEEMNEIQIEKFNSLVQSDDTVYILGDLMLGNNDEGIKCLKRLYLLRFVVPVNFIMIIILSCDCQNIFAFFQCIENFFSDIIFFPLAFHKVARCKNHQKIRCIINISFYKHLLFF